MQCGVTNKGFVFIPVRNLEFFKSMIMHGVIIPASNFLQEDNIRFQMGFMPDISNCGKSLSLDVPGNTLQVSTTRCKGNGVRLLQLLCLSSCRSCLERLRRGAIGSRGGQVS